MYWGSVSNASIDYSTGRVMSSISGMLPSNVQVLRDGIEKEVAAHDLVLGDVVSRSTWKTKVLQLSMFACVAFLIRWLSDSVKRYLPICDTSLSLPTSKRTDQFW
jgi:hypothetical protein